MFVRPYLPPANEVCEGYVFTGVCLSTLGGGHASFLFRGGMRHFIWGGGMHGFIQGGMHGFIQGGHVWFYLGGGRAWFFQFFRIQSDTVNERAVRILLECILVIRIEWLFALFCCPLSLFFQRQGIV